MGKHTTKLITSLETKDDSNILDVRSFCEADCDIDHYLVVAKIRDCQ